MEMPVTVGTVVYSRAGRDEGNYFLIKEIVDDKYVTIVDGDIRKVATPKKKKVKHLKITGERIEGIEEKMTNGKVCDAEIRKILHKYNSK